MRILSVAHTDIGRIRTNNEDSFLVDDALGLYVVADGMGGHAGGETASRMAVEYLHDAVRQAHDAGSKTGAPSDADGAARALVEGFIRANTAVVETGLRDPALRGMGTTMTALLLGRGLMHIAHIGDSRAYLVRNGRIEQLTQDHSVVAEQVRAGLLTPQAARTSPYRHVISRAIGVSLLEQPDLRTADISDNDIFLLTTDGLTEMVTDEEIGAIVAGAPFAVIAKRLIERANECGGVDNITVVALQASH